MGVETVRAVQVILNVRSGASGRSRRAIEQAFRLAGVACRVTMLRRKTDLRRVIGGLDAGTAVVAAGGDGTVNAVAAVLAGMAHAPCLGVLPFGTLNHFAKDLGMPLGMEEAARVIAEGQPRAVDAGEVNGRVFVNNSSIGFYPGLVLQRERLKKVGWNKWISLAIASFNAFWRFRHIAVCVTLPTGERMERTTPFVFVGNNEYCMEGVSAGSRARLDTGKLYLYMAPGATRMSLLRLTYASLRGRARESTCFESVCVSAFTVDHRRRVAHVSLDGEVVRLQGALHYRMRPGALQVLRRVEA